MERSATLVLTREAPDGTRVNFWVEDSENNDERVSPDIVTGLAEDFASHSIDAAYNPIRDLRFPGYIGDNGGAYNCSLTAFTMPSGACDGYSVSGSLGGFLIRQLGLDFYRNLLGNFSSTDSVAALDAAIRSTQPSSDFGQQLRAFAATSGSLMRSPSPTGFGFPARVDGSFSLPSIDPRTLLPLRTLTQSVPQRLRAYGSLPIVRSAVSGTYSEIIPVPAGTSLSVVIQ